MHVPAAVEHRWGIQKNEKLVLIPHKNFCLQKVINLIKAVSIVLFTALTLGLPLYFNPSLLDCVYYDVFYHKKLICIKKDSLKLVDMMNLKKLKSALTSLNWVQKTPKLLELIPEKRKAKLNLDHRIKDMLSVFSLCLKQSPSLTIKETVFPNTLSILKETNTIHETSYHIASCIGLKTTMEDMAYADSFTIQSGQIYETVPAFIIMDGHGIKKGMKPINEYTKKNFIPKLNFYLNAYLQDGFSIQGVYESFKAALKEIHEGFPSDYSGTTFIGIFLINHMVFCISVGDSSAYLVDPFLGTPIALAADPTHPYFTSRLQKREAYIKTTSSGPRVEGMLNMATALGDKNIVNKEGKPVIYPSMSFVTFPAIWIQAPAKIVLGTDGVFNWVTKKQMEAIMSSDTPIASKPSSLINLALSQGSQDNLACMIVDLFPG